MATETTFPVTVVYAPAARQVLERHLQLATGSTVADAVQASGLLHDLPAAQQQALAFGIWGQTTTKCHPLRANDRVEIYRPLRVDPKVARRTRFARQDKGKAAGLFARKPVVKQIRL